VRGDDPVQVDGVARAARADAGSAIDPETLERKLSVVKRRWDRVLYLVGCHAEGMVGDTVVSGVPDVPGNTVFEKKLYFEKHHDDLLDLVGREPRGLFKGANFIVPACDPDAAYGYIIGEPTEYPVMSGSNTMCVATVLLETGLCEMTEPVTELTLESGAGLIQLRCECRDGKVTSVSFLNQPAFPYHLGAQIELEGHGTLTVDVAWGGMCYVFADAAEFGFALTGDEARDLAAVGQRVKAAAAEQLEAVHPLEPRFAGITQTQIVGPLRTEDGVLTSRNAVVCSPGFVDRSPCGTGTSARLSLLHARGQIGVGEPFVHESIIDGRFTGTIEQTTTVGDYAAVVPRVAGQAWITSVQQIGADRTDPFPTGFTLNDLDIDALTGARDTETATGANPVG
jgi:proline racemase